MAERLRLAGLLTAAGASTRMGSPKGLLRLPTGQTLLEAQVAALASTPARAELVDVALVVGAFAYVHPETHTVMNPRWPEGRQTSVALGARALLARHPADALDAVLVLALDQPLTPRLLDALLEAWPEDPAVALAPSHGGRGGHPLLVPAAHLPALAALDDAPDGLRSYRSAHGLRHLAVAFPEAVMDLNDPERFAEAAAAGIWDRRQTACGATQPAWPPREDPTE